MCPFLNLFLTADRTWWFCESQIHPQTDLRSKGAAHLLVSSLLIWKVQFTRNLMLHKTLYETTCTLVLSHLDFVHEKHVRRTVCTTCSETQLNAMREERNNYMLEISVSTTKIVDCLATIEKEVQYTTILNSILFEIQCQHPSATACIC
jgi:hypothetical protein